MPAKEELSTASLRQTFTSVQIREDKDNDDGWDKAEEELQAVKNITKSDDSTATRKSSAGKTRNRATTFTCDQIVTLVSLDSGGSDSEREGSSEGNNNNNNHGTKKDENSIADKPPTLRRAGKSGELP